MDDINSPLTRLEPIPNERTGPNEKMGQKPSPLGVQLPLGRDPSDARQRIEMMEHLLERSFVIPGLNRAVGLDSIIGLIPVVGDIIAAAMGGYIVWEAHNLGLPKWKLWRMAGNIAVDTAVGAVPVAGDFLDFFFRSNSRNLRIVKKHLDKHHPESKVIDG